MVKEKRAEVERVIRTTLRVIPLSFLLGIFVWIILCAHVSLAGDRLKELRSTVEDESPWQITAKRLIYKEKEEIYIAEGAVSIKKTGQSLYAQKATYNLKTGIAEVSGDVRFEAGGDVLTGDRAVFNLKDQTGKIENGHLFLKDNHYHIHGAVMEKLSENTYLIKDCRYLTTCDGAKPFWNITASEVKVTVEGYGKVRNAAFRIHDVPVLYLPYMIFSAKTKRQTGLLAPRMGYSERNGADIEVPFFWAISDDTDATFYQRYMSKRGYMQGLEFRYVAEEDSKGAFLFDILWDRNDKKDLSDPDEFELSPFGRKNSTRYWLRGRADQNLPLKIVARLDADYVSDQDYLKEFERGLFGLDMRPDLSEESGRPIEEKRSPTRRSALRLSRDGESYSLQALAGYHQRPENPPVDTTSQPLGGLSFAVLPEQVMGLPMFFSLESDYDYVWRDEGIKGNRISVSPELRFPLWPGRYFELEPWTRYTLNSQWFDDNMGDGSHHNRRAYEGGIRTSTVVERSYSVDWRKANTIKHRFWPKLSYRYRDPQDDHDQSPWFEPIDVEGKVNRITLSLENFLDARMVGEKGERTYRQLATFSLSQDYDINEKRRRRIPGRKKEPFTPLAAQFLVRPFEMVDFRGGAQWDHYDHEITAASLSLALSAERSENRSDTFNVDYQYNNAGQESLNFFVDVYLVHGFSAGSSLQRDIDLGENISNRYWVEYTGQCWGAKVMAEREDEDTSVMLVLKFRGLGDVRIF